MKSMNCSSQRMTGSSIHISYGPPRQVRRDKIKAIH